MALSRSSALFYWSSRYGPIPVIGGRPTHVRNSAATAADARGELYSSIINTPRSQHVETDKVTAATERRAALLLEKSAANNLAAPNDFTNAAWTKTSVSVTPGVPDPAGGTSASTLTATSAGGTIVQTLSAGASAQRMNTIWIRRRTGVGFVNLRRFDGSGYDTVALTGAWQRLTPALPAASTARTFGVQFATSGDAVDVYLAQQEDGTLTTSETTGIRAADLFSWRFDQSKQGWLAYFRFIERGTIKSTTAERLFHLGKADDSNPRFLAYATGGFYHAYHGEASANRDVALPVAPVVGDTVEIAIPLTTSGTIAAIQSINGAAVTSVGPSAASAITPDLSDSVLYLNSRGTSDVGANSFLDVRFVKYADVVASTMQGMMDEIRAYELDRNGDLL